MNVATNILAAESVLQVIANLISLVQTSVSGTPITKDAFDQAVSMRDAAIKQLDDDIKKES